ncbi:MAG: hypothetical protein MUF47_09135 [Porphyrobacter sp.]|jgi:hypothetical protein|nr:hypothetical protein [Porphyrobacter sp.]
MTALALDPAEAGIFAERLWWVAAAGSLALGLLAIALQTLDPRELAGVNIWVKPAKFGFSLALHMATLALIARLMSFGAAASTLVALAAVLSVAAAAVEMVWIIRQAGLAQQSHFNVSTPFHAVMYQVMAVGAVLIIGAASVVGALVAVDEGWSHGEVLRWGIASGLIAGTALTLFTAFSIGAAMSPFVGPEIAAAARMPITGWSLDRGDLRVSHFLATHMLQIVPLAALAADRWLAPATALAAVWLIAAGWSALTFWTWAAAKAGLPLGWPS